MSLRKVKLLCSKLGCEVNASKEVVSHVLDKDGRIDKIPTILFDKDPRGNWIFSANGKGYSEFVLEETEEWINTTPTQVDEAAARRVPGIDKRYGPNVPYVSLEEALIAFMKAHKSLIDGREFSVVYEPGLEDLFACLIENKWPISQIENYKSYLENSIKTLEAKVTAATAVAPNPVESEAINKSVDTESKVPQKTQRQLAAEAKKEILEVK